MGEHEAPVQIGSYYVTSIYFDRCLELVSGKNDDPPSLNEKEAKNVYWD